MSDPVAVCRHLAKSQRLRDVEVYVKEGRSRCFRQVIEVADGELDETRSTQDRHEVGWAVRYGNARGRGFTCGSGPLKVPEALERPVGTPLSLKVAKRNHTLPIEATAEVEPLWSEAVAMRALTRLHEALPAPVRERHLAAEDGIAQSRIVNNHGTDAEDLHRLGVVRLREFLLGGVSIQFAVSGASANDAVDVAAETWPEVVRAAHAVRWRGVSAPDDGKDLEAANRETVIFAPEVAAPLVARAISSWLQPSSENAGQSLTSPVVAIVDAPDWPDSPLRCRWDGEGRAATRQVVVSQGEFVASDRTSPLMTVRHSWREPPSLGLQQPVWVPGVVSAPELIADVGSGWLAVAELDVPDRFSSKSSLRVVLGRRLKAGKIGDPQLLLVQCDSAQFCRGVREVSSDCCFIPVPAGVVGLPWLRVEGIPLTPI